LKLNGKNRSSWTPGMQGAKRIDSIESIFALRIGKVIAKINVMFGCPVQPNRKRTCTTTF
jgi:hypothetical protein